jgi:IS605 OrfB family transposase
MPFTKIPIECIKNSNYWKPSVKSTSFNSNSWFSLKGYKSDLIPKTKKVINSLSIRCKKITLTPNVKERNIILTWLKLYRLTYNMTIKYIKRNPNEKNTKFNLRNKIKELRTANPVMYGLIKSVKCPVHTLDNAVFDVIKARKTAFTNLKLGNIKYFKLRYNKQSHHLQTLVLEPTVFNKNGTGLKNKILKNLNPSTVIKTTKDTRLQYNYKTKQMILFVPYDKHITDSIARNDVCSLDPGIRTFQTIYSPSGKWFQVEDSKKIITDNIRKIENVKEFNDKAWYKKYITRIRKKLKNKIDDLHWKTSVFLCRNFNNILIGNMSTKSIVKKSNNLHSSTKRLTYALSHFQFKERLKSKAEEYNVTVKIVDESYTSKTCGGCGELNEMLGSNKIFKCDVCQYILQRDIHGARNILIKNSHLI